MEERILVTARSFRNTDGPHQRMLEQTGYQIVESPHDRALKADELGALMGGVVGAILGVDEVTADVLDRSQRLKVISRHGVGVDNVDLEAATRRGVVVTNTPGANSVSVAELTLALILALARHVPRHDRIVKQGDWRRVRGVEISGATLGLIGLGHVGREVARRAAAFGMRILYSDPVAPPQGFIETVQASSRSIPDLLSESDVVSLHCPLNEETRNLIDRQAIERLKPSALLVNTARGGLVDEQALCEALAQGKLAGAASDVFSQEPPRGSCLLDFDNFIATPHIGSATVQATIRMGQMAVENALAVLRGQRPAHVANPDVYEVGRD